MCWQTSRKEGIVGICVGTLCWSCSRWRGYLIFAELIFGGVQIRKSQKKRMSIHVCNQNPFTLKSVRNKVSENFLFEIRIVKRQRLPRVSRVGVPRISRLGCPEFHGLGCPEFHGLLCPAFDGWGAQSVARRFDFC